MKKKTKRRLIIFSIIVVLSAIYLYTENTKLYVSSHNIINNKIPKEFNNYKIAQISDFHNTKYESLRNDIINELEQQKPDIIVVTGDLADSNTTDIQLSVNFIKNIKHIAPIYYVSGNHEANISLDDYNLLKQQLTSLNVNILEDELEVLKKDNKSINLIGIDDPLKSLNIQFDESITIKKSITSINYDLDLYTILLSHRPEQFNNYVDKEIDLVFSGHAHGGQIRVPFIGGIVAPNQGFFPEYTSGLYTKDKTSMIVSRGIGNSLFPFRINDRPELIIVTLNNE